LAPHREEGGWKAAYMKWLRAAITLYRHVMTMVMTMHSYTELLTLAGYSRKRPAALAPRRAAPERRCKPTNNDEQIKVVALGLPYVDRAIAHYSFF
jgi:hypothetical protein